MKLVNSSKLDELMKNMVNNGYESVKGEEVLLCMECCDVDLYIASDSYPEFEELLKENFELDEYGDILDREKYNLLMRELDEYYIELHLKSGFYDYFPAGLYQINGREEETETDMLAPKDVFYAPFEDAVKK